MFSQVLPFHHGCQTLRFRVTPAGTQEASAMSCAVLSGELGSLLESMTWKIRSHQHGFSPPQIKQHENGPCRKSSKISKLDHQESAKQQPLGLSVSHLYIPLSENQLFFRWNEIIINQYKSYIFNCSKLWNICAPRMANGKSHNNNKKHQNYKFGSAMEDLTWKTKNPFNQREHIHTHTQQSQLKKRLGKNWYR